MSDKEQKVCPLAKGLPDSESALCIGEKCACHIRVVKPAFIAKGIVDPEIYYIYKGCGIVRTIPWNRVNRPEKGAAK
jgi:hypothetical protein